MTDTTAVTVETVEVPLLPADNKAFYRDLDVPQHASQDEVLEAAAHAFYRLCGYEPSPTTAEPSDKVIKDDMLNKSTTILAAFSTLYDAKSRATYDKFGDDMFRLLDITSHAAIEHPSYSFKGGLKQLGLFILAILLFSIAFAGLLAYYNVPGRTIMMDLTPTLIFFGMIILITIRNIVRYLYLSSTGEIKHADSQLVSAIDPSREHLVRLYGSYLVFSESAQAILIFFYSLVYLILDSTDPTDADYTSRYYKYIYLPIVVTCFVEFGTSITSFVHNGGYNVPHLGIFFHTVASRVSVDLPNLNAESRGKLFELIDSAVFTARCNALELTEFWFAAIVSFISVVFASVQPGWFVVVYIGAYLGCLVFVRVVIYLFKRHWSYAGYAQQSAA
ncbi:hypothetical protein GQ42DRAFT_163255 [Ramicandelaber brevisporus]|nr:hypothetical protein GQ42DRAFT_163255 [Ramicandelaber brevisporus]